jgi:hypothetical protein
VAAEEVAMAYPPSAVERAMKVQEVILRALSEELTRLQAADNGGCHRDAAVAEAGAGLAPATLLAMVDAATKQLLYAQLHEGGESVPAVMTALRAVLERYGLPWPSIPIALTGPCTPR